jgi:hypothetical protein
MPDVRYKGPSPQERIANRLRNSGEGANPDYTVRKGESPNRTITNVHEKGHQQSGGPLHGGDMDKE